MATNDFQVEESNVVSGLGTFATVVTATGRYTCAVTASIPLGSGLSIVIKQGASSLYTLSSPTPTQQIMGGSTQIQCTAGDSISVVISSSTAADAVQNAVKTIINFYQITKQ